MMVYSLPITRIHMFSVLTQIAFDYLLIQKLGYNAFAYLIMSSFLAGSLHPCAGHFIAEHYVFEKETTKSSSSSSSSATKKNSPSPAAPLPETYSYYGPLNILTYNVGLHNEHHDFPAIPWTRLPVLHELAKEFYADLPKHDSWVWVIWQFIWDKEVGLWCRVKRMEGGRKVGAGAGAGGEDGDAKTWSTDELGAGEVSGGMIPGVR